MAAIGEHCRQYGIALKYTDLFAIDAAHDLTALGHSHAVKLLGRCHELYSLFGVCNLASVGIVVVYPYYGCQQ